MSVWGWGQPGASCRYPNWAGSWVQGKQDSPGSSSLGYCCHWASLGYSPRGIAAVTQAVLGCIFVYAGSATRSLKAFGVTWDGAGSKQGSKRLDEASQSKGVGKGTVLSWGTRAG